ncbi:mechanosensitive ion channel domain-containing protein [Enterobacteriaceae endosymbiont of Plateumaris rustica]|uniref:mechanosensitive ion channel domain-containing protein n=1 Tax=Enterobacteriaceae endosymbiont of Plateumaris rustica TaxID=2675796 RepID=UPI001448ECBF|nr:mechanosensitive ion channel domain-containing protein [Enterobacteriaceae endosymbiont of Plateumaris rustica]QJC28988.1 mechanosensitive ion channel [Enterobacteriaceae endosymbiont of Plateumaris rustica]
MNKLTHSINFLKNWIIYNKMFIFYQSLHLCTSGCILLSGLLIIRLFTKILYNIFIVKKIDPIAIGFISNILKYLITIFVIVSTLSNMGVQTSSIIAAFGTIGLVIGLAWQSALSNLASGLLIITFRTFKIGDYINVCNNIIGQVTKVEIFSTRVKTFDGIIIAIPNGKILADNITNLSQCHEYRNKITLGLSRILISEDLNIIKKILLDTIYLDQRIIKNSKITIILDEITNISINITIFFWINDFIYKKEICSDLTNIIKQNLELYKNSCVLWINNN